MEVVLGKTKGIKFFMRHQYFEGVPKPMKVLILIILINHDFRQLYFKVYVKAHHPLLLISDSLKVLYGIFYLIIDREILYISDNLLKIN